MANDTYRIDLYASGGSFITVNDDDGGIGYGNGAHCCDDGRDGL